MNTDRLICTECGKAGPKNHRWGQTKAHSEGWFMQKNGAVFCPEHIPEWVANWRAEQKKKQKK